MQSAIDIWGYNDIRLLLFAEAVAPETQHAIAALPNVTSARQCVSRGCHPWPDQMVLTVTDDFMVNDLVEIGAYAVEAPNA